MEPEFTHPVHSEAEMARLRRSDPDLARLPHTFPTFDAEAPTPGTTNLYEQPEGPLPTPFDDPTINEVRVILPLANSAQQAATLCSTLALGHTQAVTLRVTLFNESKKREQTKPAMLVLLVQQDQLALSMVAKYEKAQQNCRKNYTMATLITTSGQLQIEGRTPKLAVLDTGAGAIILGRSFAKHIALCQPEFLEKQEHLSKQVGQKKKG